MASGGSNLGPTNKELLDRISTRVHALAAADLTMPVPSDLVMGSGSGLDPNIGLESALVQVPRIARERHVPEAEVRGLVEAHTEGRWYLFLTVPRVNVLKLNLALDKLQ
jgi:K+-transporting ATPase ATPase C chain